ncbi:hypothetical protein HHI36_005983 [Cryptolaemus montrouzieri]|uniref:Uncharacterized protein n=1 Tax=Cryptolaemus montrouzieri TaxID=559131 RepID=A0ABD2NW93_9CUCU
MDYEKQLEDNLAAKSDEVEMLKMELVDKDKQLKLLRNTETNKEAPKKTKEIQTEYELFTDKNGYKQPGYIFKCSRKCVLAVSHRVKDKYNMEIINFLKKKGFDGNILCEKRTTKKDKLKSSFKLRVPATMKETLKSPEVLAHWNSYQPFPQSTTSPGRSEQPDVRVYSVG